MSINLSRIRALCFDVDGTLSDTDDLYVAHLEHFLRRLRIGEAQRIARRLVMWLESPGNALMSLPDRFGLDEELAALIDWLYRHRRKPWKTFLLIPGVEAMLASLHGHFPMAIVSARDEHDTRAFLDHFHLTPYFDVIVTAHTTKHTKPYPDPILYAAQQMNVSPEACVMIGDTTVDMRAGKSAGAQTIGVLCGFGEADELRRAGADLILESTAQVGSLLLSDLHR